MFAASPPRSGLLEADEVLIGDPRLPPGRFTEPVKNGLPSLLGPSRTELTESGQKGSGKLVHQLAGTHIETASDAQDCR
jgi:hypothetical protein